METSLTKNLIITMLACSGMAFGAGADNAELKRRTDSLHRALGSYHPDTNVIRMLLEEGANASGRDTWGATPLYKAVQRAAERGKGGPINEKAIAEWTPVVKMLLEAGADPNLGRADGGQTITPLMMASGGGLVGVAKLLIEYKANIEAQYHGLTALACAAKEDDAVLIELLLSNGADINAGTNTALHLAARGGNAKVVVMLLANDADLSVRNAAGQTPEQWAREIYDVRRKEGYRANKDQIDRVKKVLDLIERHKRGSKAARR